MRNLFVFIFLLASLISVEVLGQIIEDPTTWAFSIKKLKDNEYEFRATCKLKPHWHIWSMNPGGDGLQVAPEIKFNKNPDVEVIGKAKEEGSLQKKEFAGVDGICNYYESNVAYVQKLKVKTNTNISGTYVYQVCDESMCLPPKNKKFAVSVNDIATVVDTTNKKQPEQTTTKLSENASSDSSKKGTTASSSNQPSSTANTASVDESKPAATPGSAEKSMLEVWFTGFGWGLASVVTPCVFAMLPMTVGFFLKRSKTKAQGKKNAVIYALSIISILTILGAIISVIGGNTLNNISTNWVVNLFFFAVFLIFGVSFLGAFELNLPASWSTFSDSKANTNSIVGIFFMALTLVIVSFSCTGPFLGNMLIESAKGGKIGPTLGFNGFSVGLALPFALFALFPSMLQKLSQGGWLNAVKVTFGIVELALALKFLSNADLAKEWRLLDREIFIALWVALSLVLSFYLLGFVRFSHDSELPKNHNGLQYLTVTRTFFALAALSFAIYLFPGLWGAPLKGMSAFLPPMGTQDFVLHGGSASNISSSQSENHAVKYGERMKIYEPESVRNFGLSTYFDYNEALEASKKLKKPVMLDFTGINCVNCRKMEAEVWSHPEVLKRLKENFIIASLYSDVDNIELPESERFDSKYLGTKVTTLGDYNEDLQATKFNSNSQPFYFYVDGEGKQLAEKGYPYDPNVEKFIQHLDNVIANYKSLHP